MNVVEKGRMQFGPLYERTCYGSGNLGAGCGTKVQFSEGDLFKTWHDCDDDTVRAVLTWACPCCGSHNDM